MKAHEIQKMASGIIGKGGKSQVDEVDDDEKDVGDFESMHIDKADNGFTVRTRNKQKSGEAVPYDEGRQHVFADDHPAIQHIHAILKHTK